MVSSRYHVASKKTSKPIYSRDEEDDANPFIKDGSQVNEHNNSYVLSENQKENEQEKSKKIIPILTRIININIILIQVCL